MKKDIKKGYMIKTDLKPTHRVEDGIIRRILPDGSLGESDLKDGDKFAILYGYEEKTTIRLK
jgi:hypothetical protein